MQIPVFYSGQNAIRLPSGDLLSPFSMGEVTTSYLLTLAQRRPALLHRFSDPSEYNDRVATMGYRELQLEAGRRGLDKGGDTESLRDRLILPVEG